MISEIEARSILIKRKKIDSWFMTHYGINLYRGCHHNCVYCDGRAETYRVEGDFGTDVAVKVNAPALLDRELNPAGKRKPMPRSYIMLGGGVCDAYQPVEERYRLARSTLQLCLHYGYPLHVLTKSTRILEDIELITAIHKTKGAIISFSLSSADDTVGRIFEPGVPSPSERLKAISSLKVAGIPCGLFLMPAIPYVTDSREMLGSTLTQARKAGADFVIFGPMTLKAGRQREYFLSSLQKYYPELAADYAALYRRAGQWGEPDGRYNTELHRRFLDAALDVGLPVRMPPRLYKNIVSIEDMVIVILQHLDYLMQIRGRSAPYGYAAHALSRLEKPIGSCTDAELLALRGIGPVTLRIIREILSTGSCSWYKRLLNGG